MSRSPRNPSCPQFSPPALTSIALITIAGAYVAMILVRVQPEICFLRPMVESQIEYHDAFSYCLFGFFFSSFTSGPSSSRTANASHHSLRQPRRLKDDGGLDRWSCLRYKAFVQTTICSIIAKAKSSIAYYEALIILDLRVQPTFS